jgi:hypothetical protein
MLDMKRNSVLGLLTLALAASTALGGPLQRNQVAADAKWILHLDLDNFRTTQVGETLVKGKIDAQMAKAAADLKTYLDVDFDWTRIAGATVYGMDFEPRTRNKKGVLLIQTTLDVQKGLENAIARQAQAGVDGNVKKLQDVPVAIYQIRAEFYVAVPAGKPVVVAQTTDLIQKGLDVLDGRTPNLGTSAVFADFPAAPKAFAFLAMAAGFSENAPIPPQANILKMTEAGRIVLGETGTQVFLSATLKAKSAESGAQMQQVLQGLLALGALNQANNQELQALVQATKVTANERMVTVDVQLPVTTIVQKIQDKIASEGR